MIRTPGSTETDSAGSTATSRVTEPYGRRGTRAVTGTVRSKTCPATDSSTAAERAGRRHERWRSVESEIR